MCVREGVVLLVLLCVALQLCLPWQFGLTPFVQWCTFSYLPMKARGDRVFAHEFAVGGEA